jgi:hypothetical protein
MTCIVINQAATIICSLHHISSKKYHWQNKEEEPCLTNLAISGNCANLHCTTISRGVAIERAVDQ